MPLPIGVGAIVRACFSSRIFDFLFASFVPQYLGLTLRVIWCGHDRQSREGIICTAQTQDTMPCKRLIAKYLTIGKLIGPRSVMT